MAKTASTDILLAERKKKWKIFYVLAILLVIALLSWGVIEAIKRYRTQKAIDDVNKGPDAGTSVTKGPSKTTKDPGTGSGSGSSTQEGTTGRPAAPPGNDNWPLKVGSQGDRVKSVQQLLNYFYLVPKGQPRIPENGIFDDNMRINLVTFVGTRYYPLTQDQFIAMSQKVPAANWNAIINSAHDCKDIERQAGDIKEKILIYLMGKPGGAAYSDPYVDGLRAKYDKLLLQHKSCMNTQGGMNFTGKTTMINTQPQYMKIGGRSCVKQWDVPSGQWIWNCGGGYIYDSHGQPF